MPNCWSCGTRTLCCADRFPGCVTCLSTGYGWLPCPGWCHVGAGLRFSRSLRPASSTCSVGRAEEITQGGLRWIVGPVLGGSGSCGHPGDFVPGAEAVGHLTAVGIGAEPVTRWPKVWRYRTERGQESLRVPSRGEPLHGAFSLPGGLVGVFRPVVQIPRAAVRDGAQHPASGR